MKTKAKIILVSENTSVLAVETANGDITVLELLSCEKVALGDVLIGHWTELDNQVVYNDAHGENLAVFIYDCGCQREAVTQQYFTPPPAAPVTAGWEAAGENPAGEVSEANCSPVASPESH